MVQSIALMLDSHAVVTFMLVHVFLSSLSVLLELEP